MHITLGQANELYKVDSYMHLQTLFTFSYLFGWHYAKGIIFSICSTLWLKYNNQMWKDDGRKGKGTVYECINNWWEESMCVPTHLPASSSFSLFSATSTHLPPFHDQTWSRSHQCHTVPPWCFKHQLFEQWNFCIWWLPYMMRGQKNVVQTSETSSTIRESRTREDY